MILLFGKGEGEHVGKGDFISDSLNSLQHMYHDIVGLLSI